MPTQKRHIVAIHGAGMHAGVFGTLAACLEMPCQAMSLPGHGKSTGAFLPSIEKMAAWTAARLDGHPLQSVVLLGHSMGALVALEAARHPSVAALVLLGAAASMPVHPELLRQAAVDPDVAADMILKWGISPVHPQALTIRAVLKEQMQSVAAAALLNDLEACHAYQRGEVAARAIQQPVLVLGGLDDRLTKAADSKLLADMLPHGQFHLVPDGGHMLMVEKPVETAREISSFIGMLDG